MENVCRHQSTSLTTTLRLNSLQIACLTDQKKLHLRHRLRHDYIK